MDFVAVLDQVIALLRQRGRVAYRTLKRQFQLDDEAVEDLKIELIDVQHVARDEQGSILVWSGEPSPPFSPPAMPAMVRSQMPPPSAVPAAQPSPRLGLSPRLAQPRGSHKRLAVGGSQRRCDARWRAAFVGACPVGCRGRPG